jgi:hypothetical protein
LAICLALLVLSFSLASLAFAASIDITNEMTGSHVEARGTGAYFIPAKGLSPSDRFSGFASEGRKIEVIAANVKSPYKEISEAFTESTLKTRGLELGSKAELSINGANATLLKALHRDDGKKWGKWILLLDSGRETLVVNGVFVSGDAEAAKDVEMMLKSIVVKNEAVSPDNAVTSESVQSDDRLAGSVSSDEGLVKDESTDKAD